MFKMITTLIRAGTADAEEAFTDAHALTLLRQQLRDAAEGLEGAKRAVAVVMAYAARERAAAARIAGQIADLESRAVAALGQGREDLATEAAAAIAGLEAEAEATARALAQYDTETRRLRETVALAEQRLRALQRGKQIADAASRTQKLRGTLPDGVTASLTEAEATLARLQARQAHAEAVETALADLGLATSAEATVTRLAAAGCGAALRPEAAQVLARLREKAL
ncbi:PspA/IM30 family protein [Rhodobacter capsulatus]|jgi:phage shock protein A|uniref:PspA/IM30 family protein n=1 Tax=Rhodobacter capsulatus (strain ATCC BAA-309 / NBRC 16581 / SB1003) TaxID=272942 RepID=D5AQG6_RHOCB|nr:PspA/IM30 family protein [Rhodobacter capsulatus]ADE86755.1 PspA/IM30 family protein [Rhodobacter capsulatus SB 1003]ETD00314.1 PspA family regulator [Rhodobacter capsulatus DE442]ETD74654.1 PspA family regulator [Rhodobacter capsulatus R121]ETE52517.1 PspA family regulator [Rhodobacter capsulatus Y262]MDS0928555.1 PspA/IM30 family protein [Rhodobacter capsulatus]